MIRNMEEFEAKCFELQETLSQDQRRLIDQIATYLHACDRGEELAIEDELITLMAIANDELQELF